MFFQPDTFPPSTAEPVAVKHFEACVMRKKAVIASLLLGSSCCGIVLDTASNGARSLRLWLCCVVQRYLASDLAMHCFLSYEGHMHFYCLSPGAPQLHHTFYMQQFVQVHATPPRTPPQGPGLTFRSSAVQRVQGVPSPKKPNPFVPGLTWSASASSRGARDAGCAVVDTVPVAPDP